MTGSKPSKSTLPAKVRIIEAAAARFSRYSYEETGLRDIAADAKVDVAYVHRCFGSKERLFAQALAAVSSQEQMVSSSRDFMAQAFTEEFFRKRRRGDGDAHPLSIFIRSLTSAEARRVLRKSLAEDYVRPLSERLEDSTSLRAALILAFLAGVGIFRDALEVDAFQEPRGGRFERLFHDIITRIIEMDVAPPKGRELVGSRISGVQKRRRPRRRADLDSE
ncbi:transcriptional regulator, TetR family [Enhydrobacter aerosaccus]|uniref:Transcriptional regulator, TetR family n=1 Tax=Enhydrobacter aerosaccus TaxID=225324 RepID=A0A1T4TJ70_9HYPH|nr:TetR/AcrR family transcriptional regulator [Enhydrobacter aerosaccus]SKA40497.1 transcriptional regulator, TetR family [Enhydrobacter aerosaccus]